MEHTPIPWQITKRGDGWVKIGANDGHGDFAKVSMRPSRSNNVAEYEANAHLIITAPKLLAMLERVLTRLTDDHECIDCGQYYESEGHEEDCIVPELENTIVNARGES